MSIAIARPGPVEHAPYFSRYIDLVPDGSITDVLASQIEETASLLSRNPDKGDHAYGPGKWTVKEVVGHIIDGERVFVYRAVRFARADRTELPGFDENLYVANGNFAARALDGLIDELRAVRQATIAFATALTPEAAARTGVANGKEVSVRALLYMCAGHELHHVRLLVDRYGLV